MQSTASLKPPPFYHFTRLIENLDLIIHQYLKKRFGVPHETFGQQTIPEVLQILSYDSEYYRAKSIIQFVDSKVRHYVNNNGKTRLGTLGFLYALRLNLIDIMSNENLIERRLSLIVEINALFAAIAAMIQPLPAEDKSIFHQYHGKYYILYGLNSDSSELKQLIDLHILQTFHREEMLAQLDADVSVLTEQRQAYTDIKEKLMHAEEQSIRLAAERELLQQMLSERHPKEEIESYPVSDDDGDFAEKISIQLGVKVKHEERIYPILKPQTEKGCTDAQLHVIGGRYAFLKALLQLDGQAINAICADDSKNGVGKRSLCELALFDNKREGRLDMLALVLSYRPYITCPSLPVLDQVLNRMSTEVPDIELCILFFKYVIAQKTCTGEAREALRGLIGEINHLVANLLNTQLKTLVQELQDPIDYCRLLAHGYLEGDFDELNKSLAGQAVMMGAELYEVMWSAKQRQESDRKNSHLLRHRLEEMLKKHLNTCYQLKPGNKTAGFFDATKPNEYVEELLEKYANLIDKISRVIMRFGVVLSTKGFNEYQIAEINLQIQREQSLAPLLKK